MPFFFFFFLNSDLFIFSYFKLVHKLFSHCALFLNQTQTHIHECVHTGDFQANTPTPTLNGI